MSSLSGHGHTSFKKENIKKDFTAQISFKNQYKNIANFSSGVVIPTYKPGYITYKLAETILKWDRHAIIVIVDDCTPLTSNHLKLINKINTLAKLNRRVKYLRTSKNQLKAGALNYGLNYLFNLTRPPKVVFTMDDDIRINKKTLATLKAALYSHDKVGAVCSRVWVTNKNQNILTRLQALEYQSFNVTKMADNYFLKGPLVMQGMLTAFRASALQEVKGFTPGHLIEDYDITARLKDKGWRVKMATEAIAGTAVPEKFGDLWRQRVRWTYWGLWVVGRFWKSLSITFQDTIGHILFLALLMLVALSLLVGGVHSYPPIYLPVLVTLAIEQFILATIYNLIVLMDYRERDKKDWILKLIILPEFIYCNILSLVLVGSYLFFLYSTLINSAVRRIKLLSSVYQSGLWIFKNCGYSLTWGTRQNIEKGGSL